MYKDNRAMTADIVKVSGPVLMEEAYIFLAGGLFVALIGRMGADSLAVFSLAGLVQSSVTGVIGGIGTGAAVLVARAAGAGNHRLMQAVAAQAMTMAVLTGTIIAAAGYCLTDYLTRLIAADIGSPTFVAVSRCLWLSTPLILAMQIGKALLQGLGATSLAFRLSAFHLTTIISLAALAAIFAPHLGIAGIAGSSIFAAAAGLVLCLFLLRGHDSLKLTLRRYILFDINLIKTIIKLSAPVIVEQFFLQTGFSLFILLLAGIGSNGFAANQIAQQIEGLSLAFGSCLAVATLALTGRALGRHDIRLAGRYTAFILRFCLLAMTLCGLVSFYFAKPLVALFTADPEVSLLAVWCLSIALLEQPTLAVVFVISNALRAAGDTRSPMLATIIGIWLVRLPLALLLFRHLEFGVPAAWAITATDYLIRSVILLRRYRSILGPPLISGQAGPFPPKSTKP